MFGGKSIFPAFAVDRPLPAGTQPPLFTVGQPKPETIPADIITAMDDLILAVHAHMRAASPLGPEYPAFLAKRDALDAAILRHLRGEA